MIKNKLNISLNKKFENIVLEYINLFCKKHELEFDYWVADLVGTVGVFGDYFFSLEEIRVDIDTNQSENKIFEWYEHRLKDENSHVNYYFYCYPSKKEVGTKKWTKKRIIALLKDSIDNNKK